MRGRATFGVFVAICLIGSAAAQALTFPALTGRVVDEAGILDATDRAALSESLAGLETKTTDQLVVVTLKSLQGTSIEDYGYQLGRSWQIGQKDKNNGVLLIVAPNERKVRIDVGYGLEGTLTDAISKVVIENSILPRFKAGDFSGGIKRGVEDIVQILSGDAEDWQRRAAQNSSSDVAQPATDTSIWPAIIIVLIGVMLLMFCAARGGAVCQGIMQILALALLSGKGGSSRGSTSWSGGSGSFGGGGGSFGGGGASGSW